LIAVAVEETGEGIGRIRMRRIPDASADSLQAFIEQAVAPGSLLYTDGFARQADVEGEIFTVSSPPADDQRRRADIAIGLSLGFAPTAFELPSRPSGVYPPAQYWLRYV